MKTKKIVYVALFIAIGLVFNRFLTFQTPFLKIGFGFIPNILSSIAFGPFIGGLINAMVDFIGATAMPKGGAFFPGFTVSAFISGVIYGLFLYKKEVNYKNLTLAIVTNMIIISLGLNTYWISLLSGKGFLALVPLRITKELIMLPIEVIVFKLLYKYLFKAGLVKTLNEAA